MSYITSRCVTNISTCRYSLNLVSPLETHDTHAQQITALCGIFQCFSFIIFCQTDLTSYMKRQVSTAMYVRICRCLVIGHRFSYVYLLYSYMCLLHCVCIDSLTLDAGLLARSQYPEGPATGHLDTGFSWFPCAYKRMLRWFPSFQVATTCFSCSPPDLNFLVTFFHICVHVK